MELHCWWSCAQLGAASYFLGSHNLRFNIPPNLPRALRKGAVSSGIFALTRFLTICFFFYKLHRISTKLGQNVQLVSGYKSYQQFDPKRYIGATGVKNVKKYCLYGKCYYSNMIYSRATWQMYTNKFGTLFKFYCLRLWYGVIWGHQEWKVHFLRLRKNVSSKFSENLLSWALYMCCSLRKRTEVI